MEEDINVVVEDEEMDMMADFQEEFLKGAKGDKGDKGDKRR